MTNKMGQRDALAAVSGTIVAPLLTNAASGASSYENGSNR
jgi:hypothetical protein